MSLKKRKVAEIYTRTMQQNFMVNGSGRNVTFYLIYECSMYVKVYEFIVFYIVNF